MQLKFGARLCLSLLLASLMTVVKGQFNILPLPAGQMYMKAQLWNLTVTNTGTSTVSARIQLDMKDMQTHQSVLSALSTSFHIAPGSSMVQMQSLEPILYTYNSPVVVDRTPNGLLPIGQYQVCYQLLVTYGESQTTVADDCENIEVEPLSPPLLTMPENDSVLATSTPILTWVPPAPINMFNNLTYDLLISEVYDGQSIADAIQKNLPWQQAQGLTEPFLSYPLAGPQLEKGKTYAWQVIARDGQQYAAKSEIWTFKMPDSQTVASHANSTYILMDGGTIGSAIADSGMLHIKYVSTLSAYQVTALLKDDKGNQLQTIPLVIRQGDNYLDIALSSSFQSKQHYSIFIPDKAGKMTFLPFSIK